jgi:hypothetical protein
MDEKIAVIARGRVDRKVFINEIFSQSFPKFIGGKYIDDVAEFYGSNQNTIRVSPRDHFKSTGVYAAVMYDILYSPINLEAHYFSYKYSMSVYHMGKIKDLVAANPYFEDCIDMTRGRGRIEYIREGKKITVNPHGMLSFKRGIHALRLYVDDPFQDPSNTMNPTILLKINDIFVNQIMNMLTQGGRLHVVGTPQSNGDFFFNDKINKGFGLMVKPAVISYQDKIALWPEYMPFDVLMAKKAIDERSFQKEFMCEPVYSENSYFKEPQIQSITNSKLQNYIIYDKIKSYSDVVAGFDIGKKAHPSHLAVFEKRGEDKWVQIHSKFMDGWNYNSESGEFDPENPTQLEYLGLAIENFDIDELYYDNTRGEFESVKERGKLPPQMIPVTFSNKEKQSMATEFSISVQGKTIELIDDQRQCDQLLMVTNDLKALETPMGHGDSFWSIGLAHKGMTRGDIHLDKMYGSVEEMRRKNRHQGQTAGLMTKSF